MPAALRTSASAAALLLSLVSSATSGDAPFSRPRAIVQYQVQEQSPQPAPQRDNHIPYDAASFRSEGVADLDCITRAMVFEAHSQDFDSLLAVGTIVANRADSRSPRFPRTWCGVVGQAKQFSTHPLQHTPDPGAYATAYHVAQALQSGLRHPALAKVVEFRTAGTSGVPGLTFVGDWGGNDFYR